LPDAEECFRLGLLRRVKPSAEKGRMSLAKARRVLEEGGKNLGSEAYDSCVLSAYMAMFHAARAVLFRDGVREKSHFCLARYLERYVDDRELEEKWVDLLDRIRDVRHAGQYDLSYSSTSEEARSCLRVAKDFVERMEVLFRKTKAGGAR
jgi:uncharacterized protein (UPF0332 family)